MTAMLTLCYTWPQVSTALVSLHQDCLQGKFSSIQQLKGRTITGAHSLAQSQQEVVRGFLFSCWHETGCADICYLVVSKVPGNILEFVPAS